MDVSGADDNTIGGTPAGARNLISGNGGDGIQVIGGLGTTSNEILGNYIGTDRSGTNALGNTEAGVLIFSVKDNTVGGTVDGARNIISSNADTALRSRATSRPTTRSLATSSARTPAERQTWATATTGWKSPPALTTTPSEEL